VVVAGTDMVVVVVVAADGEERTVSSVCPKMIILAPKMSLHLSISP
jgi:hypothetical protein